MTATPNAAETSGALEMSQQLQFAKRLQTLSNKIHSTANVSQILYDLARDIADLFDCDRVTFYMAEPDGRNIVSRLKTGLDQFREIRLPISAQSIAGFCALSRQVLNIHDVYDAQELKRFNPHLRFLSQVDQATGYHSRQMLVAPILQVEPGDVLGVIQLINNRRNHPFSAEAEGGILELCKTMAIAMQQRSAPRIKYPPYDSLVEAGAIGLEALGEAVGAAREQGVNVEDVLIDKYHVAIDAIGRAAAHFYGVSYEPFKRDRVKPIDLFRNLKREYIEGSLWIPVDENDDGIVIMSPDVGRLLGSAMVAMVFKGRKIRYAATTWREFKLTVDQFFASADLGDILDRANEEEGGEDVMQDTSAAADSEVVQLVNKVIIDAFQAGASDIHIEPSPGKAKTQIRFRRDGALYNYLEIPASLRNPVIARLKIMCDLDIAERRLPQDGKIKFSKFGPLDIELRVATCPTQGGVEDVVMRLLAHGEPLPLEKMGFSPRHQKNLLECIAKPYGLFFVCGPTGSGKTTTLHAVLKYLNKPDTKIWTAEDPVEITQAGLRQVQMNPKAGLNFARAMKSFLRADPDIIMVGEMRDAETAGIGIEASLTGHLVLSTLHTNSAPETIIRLVDMGMDPFNFADALLGIMAQRLSRRLCGKCKQPREIKGEELDLLLDEYCMDMIGPDDDGQAIKAQMRAEWERDFLHDGKFMINEAVGCPECDQTGYRGRVALHELLVGSDGIKRLIQEKARVAELRHVAIHEGMRTLKQDGIEKVLLGHTDMHEVRSVCVR